MYARTMCRNWAIAAVGIITAWLAVISRAPNSFVMLILELDRSLQLVGVYIRWHAAFVFPYQAITSPDHIFEMLSKGNWVPLRIGYGNRSGNRLIAAVCDISVIIPALNEEKHLSKCLKSLVGQSSEEMFEVIVVDGGSKDGTVEVARQYADKVVAQAVRPVGAARNVGVKHARGDIVAFVDADTIVCDGWLEQLSRAFVSNSRIIGVTGPTLPYEGTELDRLVYQIATGYCQRLSFKLGIPHVAGFNCAYRREPFLNVGGFDQNRQLSEDVMLSLRIRREGRILFDPRMIAYTSLRRIKKCGYPYLTTYYVINIAMMLLFDRTLRYPEVR
jgi:GT2 family glycosyltransferase